MANIMVNQICNLRCPYCFANEFVNMDSLNNMNMSIENFKKALNFALTSPNERIGIIGGEPTLHPNFKEMLTILVNDKRVKKVVLFTNGTNLEKYFNILTHSKFTMLINCNSPNDIGEYQFSKMVRNIDIMINEYFMKDKISLGINMYKPEFEYAYIIDLLKKYNFNHVRTSISVPNTDEKKEYDVKEFFNSMKSSVFNFFRELEQIKVVPRYDCNLMPPCIPSSEELKWLSNFNRMAQSIDTRGSNIDGTCSTCTPVIDILPDLNAVRCFGLSGVNKIPIRDFKNITELRHFFANMFDNFAYNIYSSKDCKDCINAKSMKCIGGCMAFKIGKIEKARKICADL